METTKKALIVGAASLAMTKDLLMQGEAAVILPSQTGKTMAMEGYEPEPVDFDRVTKDEDGSFRVSPTPVISDDGLPNRLSIDRTSPYYTNCGAYVGVKFNGEEVATTIEFSVSGGWIRRGSSRVVKQQEIRDAPKEYGRVEVFWRSTPSRQVRRQIARMAR